MDSQLVVRAQQGDRGAFTAIVDAIGGRLYAIAFSVLRDRELANDATQETLLTAWRDLQKLRDPDRLEAWTCRILVRTCRAEARQANRWLPAMRERPGPEPAIPDETASVLAMFNATRVAAGIATLTLAASLALVAGPATQTALAPAAQDGAIDPADFGGFSGTMRCVQGEYGQTTTTEWGSIVIGETYPRCTVEVSDPRINGNNHSIHDYYKYDGRPQWGVRSFSSVITNDDGSWIETDGWGYQHPEDGTMLYAGQYRGTGAYEGLSALLVLSQDQWGLVMDVEGVIIPGDLPEAPEPPIEAASGSE